MSKIEKIDQPATSATGLVSMQFIGRICDARTAALAQYEAAARALAATFAEVRAAGDVAGVAHGGHGCARHSTRETKGLALLFGEDFDPAASITAVRRDLDARIWTRLLEETGLRSMMDLQERRAFDTSLCGDDVPEATIENVTATFQRLCADAETIFLRGLARAFSSLDRRFKSHDGFKVGSRIILDRLMSDMGTWNYRSDVEGALIDIERIFAMFDGEQPSPGGLRRAIEANRGWGARQSATETRYFKVRIFKNGNAHLWMQRPDLVRKVNLKLAAYYGDALADAAPADCGPDIFKTRSNVPAKDLAFYPTPAAVAELALKELYCRSGMRVLEPSAGVGNLVWPLLDKGALVDAIEIHPDRAAALQGRQHPGLTVRCANFLSMQPQEIYDAVVMNPPFAGTHYMDHVMQAWAFLKPGGKLVAILPASASVNETPKHEKFRAWAAKVNRDRWSRVFTDLPAESFREVGVNINTVVMTLSK